MQIKFDARMQSRDKLVEADRLSALKVALNMSFISNMAVGSMQRVLVRGLERVDQMFMLTMTAFNITRMRTLREVRLKAQAMGC